MFFLLLPNSCTQRFEAIEDGDVTVEILFPEPIITRYLRILPSACSKWCVMKFEVLGVNLTECPLGESMFSLSVCRGGGGVWSFVGWVCLYHAPPFFLRHSLALSYFFLRPSWSVRWPSLPPSLPLCINPFHLILLTNR